MKIKVKCSFFFLTNFCIPLLFAEATSIFEAFPISEYCRFVVICGSIKLREISLKILNKTLGNAFDSNIDKYE